MFHLQVATSRSKLKHAKYQHDEIFLTKAYLPTNVDDTLGPKVKDRPYLLGEETIDSDFMEKKIKYNIAINKNLFPNELKPDMKYYWEGIFFLRNRTQELCKGTVSVVIHRKSQVLNCNIHERFIDSISGTHFWINI